MLVTRPCPSSGAYLVESYSWEERKVDLPSAARCLEERGFKVRLLPGAFLEVVVNGVRATLYRSGRVMVYCDRAEEALAVAGVIHGCIGRASDEG